MDCIIKNTKTVDEFKRVRASMEERAERYSRRHIASCEHWQDGLPVKLVLIIIRDVQNALPFFYYLQVKSAHVYKPPAGR